MKNKEYWAERFRQLEASQHRSSEKLTEDIQRQMSKAEAEIEKKIYAWYGRLAANNGVSMAEARKLLRDRELEEFRWDVEEYIKYGKENALNGQWMKELENASARVHISRLEQLKLQVQQEAEKLYGNYLDSVDRHMKSLYEEGFYKTAYEIQRGVGVGWNLTGVDPARIDKVIRKPWTADGKNFSERIWSSKQQLIDNVHTSLTQMCILGQSPDRAIGSLAKSMQTSKNQAGRLIMTESAFFGSEARKDSFQELGVEKYEILATLDSITSEICREMDGKVFPMSEYEAGVTAPPFHVWCRSTTVPAFGDEFDNIGERAARGEDGKTYYVPASMTYKDWKESFVDGGDKSGFAVYNQNGTNHWTRKENPDKIGHMNDITQEWTKTKGTKGLVSELHEYIIKDTAYKVDGKHVILHPTEQEREVAAILSEKYGKSVEFVPQVMYPLGIQTPDYLVDGVKFDLKSPTGSGKNLLYGMLAKKKKQSPNFIFDITDCPLSEEEIESQINGLYASQHTKFVEKIVVVKSGEILKVYDR